MKTDRIEMDVNLHTHTQRCGHATGQPEDYCKAAEEKKLQILGFSDHAPFPDHRFHSSRMNYNELSAYREDIEIAKKAYPNLTLLAGLEIEYCPDIGIHYYTDELLGKFQFDYLIGAAHFVTLPDQTIHPFYTGKRETEEVLMAFIHQTIQTMENLPILYMAHPDCMGNIAGKITPSMKSGFREIAQLAEEKQIALEINANGFRKGLFETEEGTRFRYPLESFWEIIAEYNVPVVVGSDAHAPELVVDHCDDCISFAQRFGLKIRNREIAQKLMK